MITNTAENNGIVPNPSPSPSPSSSSSSRVNTTQACAACKYQRRKCAPDCILAPYFPHDRQRQFLNAHKLFGVSNITKIIRNLEPPEKDIAMRTIMIQSDVRASDPVGGCYRIIKHLEKQIEFAKAELGIVLHQLALCRSQHQEMFVNNDQNNDVEALGACYEQLQINYDQNQNQNQNEEFENYVYEVTNDSWGLQGSSASSMPTIAKQHSIECNSIFKPLFEGLSDESPEFRFEPEQTIEPSDEQAGLKNEQAGFKEQDEGSFQVFDLAKCDT